MENEKIGILGDLHLGIQQDSAQFLKIQLDYLDKYIQYLIDNEIHQIIQLGDFFNSRKYINVRTIYWVKKRFLDKLRDNKIDMIIVTGNHDIFYNTTNDVTSLMNIHEYDNVTIITRNKMMEFNGMTYGFVPWLNDSTENNSTEAFMKFISNNKIDYLFGHFDIKSFSMSDSKISEEGLDPDVFLRIKKVFSGHYHTKQIKKNIIYTGTPYQLNWGDYGIEKGFYVIEGDDIEFIENTDNIYKKIYYDESKIGDMIEEIKDVSKNILKIYTPSKKNYSVFNQWLKGLESKNPIGFNIIELTEELSSNNKIDNVLIHGSLMEVIKKYLQEENIYDDLTYKLMNNLYESTKEV